jgi:hypothetical protein
MPQLVRCNATSARPPKNDEQKEEEVEKPKTGKKGGLKSEYHFFSSFLCVFVCSLFLVFLLVHGGAL